MKVELCAKKREWTEPCTNQKFCCSSLKSIYHSHHLEFNDRGVAILNLRDYDDMRYHTMYGSPERIPMLNAIPINNCPFCGEKIE